MNRGVAFASPDWLPIEAGISIVLATSLLASPRSQACFFDVLLDLSLLLSLANPILLSFI